MAIIEDTTTHAVAEVAATTSITAGDVVLGVHDPGIPVLGTQTAAASMSVTPASDLGYAIGFPTLGAATLLSVSGTTAATAALTAGRYLVVSTVDVCWEQNAAAQWLAGDSKFLPAGVLLPCTLAAQTMNAITGGASGTLMVIPVS